MSSRYIAQRIGPLALALFTQSVLAGGTGLASTEVLDCSYTDNSLQTIPVGPEYLSSGYFKPRVYAVKKYGAAPQLLAETAAKTPGEVCSQLIGKADETTFSSCSSPFGTAKVSIKVLDAALETIPNGNKYACRLTTQQTTTRCNGTELKFPAAEGGSGDLGACSYVKATASVTSATTKILVPSSIAEISPWVYGIKGPHDYPPFSSLEGAAAYNRDVTLYLKSSLGTYADPGTLSHSKINTTRASNRQDPYPVIYTPPATWSKSQTITITAQCNGCESGPTWPASAGIRAGWPYNTHKIILKGQDTKLIGLFNGVFNTRTDAQNSLKRLREEYGDSYKYVPLEYHLFYNQPGCGGGASGKASCLEDIAEVFALRNKELGGVLGDRWEIFWETVSGKYAMGDSLTGKLLFFLGYYQQISLLQLLDTTATAILNKILSSTLALINGFKSAPSEVDLAVQLTELQQYADQDTGMVLVAHSQGNLFVNEAYKRLLASRPGAKAQVVHVAPASPTVNGPWVLVDIDTIINGLRLSGINSVPDYNTVIPTRSSDPSGHTFIGTYMDKTRAAYRTVRNRIFDALDKL